MTTTKSKALYLGFVYSTIFGFSFMFTKMTLGSINSIYHLLALRFLIAFSAMTLLLLLGVIKVSYKGKKVLRLVPLGLFQPVIYFIFETKGIALVPSSQAGIMMACIPILVIILAKIFLHEHPSILQILFVILSVIGAVVININSLSTGNLLGTIFLLIAVLAAAVYSILSRNLSNEFSAVEMTYLMMGFGAVTFNAISSILHMKSGEIGNYFEPFTHPSALIGLLYLGILSSIVAFFLLNYTLSKVEASKTAVFANFTTVVSVIAGILLLREHLMVSQVVGGVMILIGVYGAKKASERVD
ncbi:MAG: EamA family transporter [Vallitaleaceae bacterium]|nr:EamA family transporter [Vallitaleaceae bacterium]